MKKYLILLLCLFMISSTHAFAQLKGGPMQGYATENTVSFWMMIEMNDTLSLNLMNTEAQKVVSNKTFYSDSIWCFKNDCSIKTTFRELKAGTSYHLEIYLNDEWQETHKFRTKDKNKSNKDFSVLTGSCAFIPFGWGNLIFPFHNLKIYDQMEKKSADFMLWLGDTVYYIKDENKERKIRRNIKYRKKQALDDFLSSKPQIAMWDDHDFGPNNADGNYEDKKASLSVFNNFWVNPKSKMSDGSYYKINHEDVEFYVLDNRSYSTSPEAFESTILGTKQKSWLKRNLKKSKATFKIICSGNQFIADYLSDKTFALYPKERKEILDFIKKNKIEGIFFLSGDRHHTEFMVKHVEGIYPMYEYSSSPITSWANMKFNSKRFNKDQRVEGSLVNKRNFGKLSFIGGTGNRKMIIETFDKKGKMLWTRIIEEKELKF